MANAETTRKPDQPVLADLGELLNQVVFDISLQAQLQDYAARLDNLAASYDAHIDSIVQGCGSDEQLWPQETIAYVASNAVAARTVRKQLKELTIDRELLSTGALLAGRKLWAGRMIAATSLTGEPLAQKSVLRYESFWHPEYVDDSPRSEVQGLLGQPVICDNDLYLFAPEGRIVQRAVRYRVPLLDPVSFLPQFELTAVDRR